jgi:hypothetical protein
MTPEPTPEGRKHQGRDFGLSVDAMGLVILFTRTDLAVDSEVEIQLEAIKLEKL